MAASHTLPRPLPSPDRRCMYERCPVGLNVADESRVHCLESRYRMFLDQSTPKRHTVPHPALLRVAQSEHSQNRVDLSFKLSFRVGDRITVARGCDLPLGPPSSPFYRWQRDLVQCVQYFPAN